METKIKRILNRVINVLAVVIGVLVLVVAVSAISSASVGYTSFFGSTAYAVKSDSMQGTNADSFNKGDLIFVKLLNADEKDDLQPGQVITFFDNIDNKRQLNTHRIVRTETTGGEVTYITKGDKEGLGEDTSVRSQSDIVGVYSSKIGGLGNFVLFIQSPTGFLVLVVIPSVLVVGYCAYLMVKNLKDYNKEKKSEDYDKMREEVLKELQKQEGAKEGGAQAEAEAKKE